MALRKSKTKVSKAVDPECSVLRTAGLVDPHCPVHGFAVERTGGLEMIQKLESRIEMLEAQLQKKTTTKKDVVEARNAIFNRFREGGGAFPSKKDGGDAPLASPSATGCVTIGGYKNGTCNFANLIFDAGVNIRSKILKLSAAFTEEKDHACWQQQYPPMQMALDKCAKEFFDLVVGPEKLKGGREKAVTKSFRSGGICAGLPGTGSYFLGGKKEKVCSFVNQRPLWLNIQEKIFNLSEAVKKEKQDGCYKRYESARIQKAFDNAIGYLDEAAAGCTAANCTGTVSTPAFAAPAQAAKTGGKAKSKRSAKQQAAIAIAIKSKKTKKSVKPKAKAKPKVKAKKTVKPKAKAKAKKAKAKKTCSGY